MAHAYECRIATPGDARRRTSETAGIRRASRRVGMRRARVRTPRASVSSTREIRSWPLRGRPAHPDFHLLSPATSQGQQVRRTMNWYFVGGSFRQRRDSTAAAVVERAETRGEWGPRVFAWRKVAQVTQLRELAGRRGWLWTAREWAGRWWICRGERGPVAWGCRSNLGRAEADSRGQVYSGQRSAT